MQASGFHIAPPIVRAKARLAGTLASQLQALVDTSTPTSERSNGY
jgi:hypothetical protein